MNLEDLIYPDLIFSDMKAADQKEAMKQITDSLMEKGFVKDGYYEMLMEREAVYPTGLRTEPFAVAVPHTDPECVMKPCIAVARLRDPVEFAEMGNETQTVQVKYIFNLVLQKMEQQLELLQTVIGVFTNSYLMERLGSEHKPDKIAEILCGQENDNNFSKEGGG